MRRFSFLALVLCMMVAVLSFVPQSGYAQTDRRKTPLQMEVFLLRAVSTVLFSTISRFIFFPVGD